MSELLAAVLRGSPEGYGPEYGEHLFQQYLHFVASAETISERRVAVSQYLLTVNAALISGYGLLADNAARSWFGVLVPLAGILVSATWYQLLRSYRTLNKAKFVVIHELEEAMPAAPYTLEWEKLEHGKILGYRQASELERLIPVVFFWLHVILLVLGVVAVQRP